MVDGRANDQAVEQVDEIERLRHDGRVHRWSRAVPGWPGHTTFVALRGGEVVVGDRYAGEGIERTYACDPASLLDGCFQELVAQQLGPAVLAELLAEVRRTLGAAAPTDTRPTTIAREPVTTSAPPAVAPPAVAPSAVAPPAVAPPAVAPPAVAPPAVAPPAVAPPAKGAQTPAAAPTPARVASAAPRQAPAVAAAPERPSAAVSGGPTPAGGRVDVAVVACPNVSLPVAVALRGITRVAVHELLGRLRSLPCRVAAGVPREQAEGLVARLAELGVEAQLVATAAS